MTALSVPSLNLMPAGRLISGKRRRRVRAWACALAVYGTVAAGVWGYFTFMSVTAESVADELAKADARLKTVKAELAQVNAQVTQARREAEARHEVQFHPDFSILLRRVAYAAGGVITLDKVELGPMPTTDPKAPKTDLAAPFGYRLKLTGLAATQGDVPTFAKELEKLGLFETVSVQSIRAREAPVIQREDGTKIATPQLFMFEIEGVMSDKGAGGRP